MFIKIENLLTKNFNDKDYDSLYQDIIKVGVNIRFNKTIHHMYFFIYVILYIYIKCVPPATPQKKNAVSVAKKDAVSISIGAVAFPCL